jgi:hypothetical protein
MLCYTRPAYSVVPAMQLYGKVIQWSRVGGLLPQLLGRKALSLGPLILAILAPWQFLVRDRCGLG